MTKNILKDKGEVIPGSTHAVITRKVKKRRNPLDLCEAVQSGIKRGERRRAEQNR